MGRTSDRVSPHTQRGLRGSSAVILLTALLALALGSACSGGGGPDDGQNAQPPAPVIASSAIWADVVSAVSCGRIPVESLVPPGRDAHEFELTLRAADRVLRSRLVFTNGLGLDTPLRPTLDLAERSGLDVVALGDFLPADAPPLAGDPHFWMDPQRVAAVVGVMESHLRDLGLMDEAELARCAAAYRDRLDRLTATMADALAAVPVARRKLVTEHHNLGYFADRFGFTVLGALNDSSSSLAEADPRHLERLRAGMRAAGIDTVFVESGESDARAAALVRDVSAAGSVVPLHIEIPPRTPHGPGADPGDLYLTMLATDAERVAAALAH